MTLFRHCATIFGTVRLFREKSFFELIFFLAAPPARIFYTSANNYYGADAVVAECYVKRMCNSLKMLIRMYKNELTIKTIFKTYKCIGFVCIPSSSTILSG